MAIDTKITDLTAQTTPDDADLFVDVDVSDTTMSASGTDKKITWANIKATLLTYLGFTKETTTVSTKIDFLEGTDNGTNKTVLKGADNQASDTTLTLPSATDTLVGKATTDILTNKTLDTPIIRSWDGWMDANETWTYASASTFTISGDKTNKYQVGDKIKFNQTTDKYFYIHSVSYGAPNTTITIVTNTSYTIANATITSPQYSRSERPFGFPTWLRTSFSAYLSANTSYADSTTIIFDTENYDINSNYNNSTGIFTAPISGLYEFVCNIGVGSPTDQQRYGIIFQVNGSNYQIDKWQASGTSTFYANASSRIKLNQGDTVSVLYSADATKTIAQNETKFSGYLLLPTN